MSPFSLLIKPASADCNLRCEYCFYLDRCRLYPSESKHRMPDAVLEEMIRSYMHTDQPEYVFGWQGGEPTLMGLGFFKRVVELQQKYGKPGSTVANGLQTNGMLITDEMAELFANYKFLLGVSLDGPPEIHDTYRTKPGGGGSHARVMEGIRRLEKHNVEFNILTLVSQSNVHNAADVYNYLTDHNFLFHQYIPCVEPGENSRLAPFSISSGEWGGFLCEVFDQWYPGDTRRVSIRLFDSILNLRVDNKCTVCHMGDNCCKYFVVEYNGDIYPCDFFVEKQLKLGNVSSDSWEDIQESAAYKQFGGRKRNWDPACNECEWEWICAGDCMKHRLWGNGGETEPLSHLCGGWKQFFSHTMPAFKQLAEEIRRERAGATRIQIDSSREKPGRNDPCPCGSGRKYKKCCAMDF